MDIYLNLDKDFEAKVSDLKVKYPELAEVNGLSNGQLNHTQFIDNFVEEDVVADSSIDGNSNVSTKNMVTLEREMMKPHKKLLAFNKIYYEIKKKYGKDDADRWLEAEFIGQLYMHDGDTASFKHYCFSYSIKDLAERGLFFLPDRNAVPPKHLSTFVDFVKEFISTTSNLSSGAVGLADLIPYMFYFWKKDCDGGYAVKDPKYHAKQNFQRFIYAVNQPATRDGMQSAFTNTSVYDRPYFEALFGGSTFPDGTFMIDYEEEIIEFQKWYMETMAEIRSETMFTFPVSSISLIRKDGKFEDEEFAEWAIRHNMQWADSNMFIDEDVTSLSNCPLAPDTKILYWMESKKRFNVSDIKTLHNTHGSDSQIKVLSNGELVDCRINKFNIAPEYEIELVTGHKFVTTGSHMNKVYGSDEYVTTENLTEENYIPFSKAIWHGSDSMTYEDGRVIGMFLGDGSYSDENGVTFSLNRTTKNDAIEFLHDYIPRKFGGYISEYECTSELSGEKSCVNVSIRGSKMLRGMISQYVDGDNALNKKIAYKALNCSVPFRRGIVDGLYETDGGNSNRIYTSSIGLRDSLVTLLATLGEQATNLYEDSRDGRLGGNTNYTVRIYDKDSNKKSYKGFYISDENYRWIKIRKITKLDTIARTSYCLEICDGEKEPVFMLANGIITHNCRLKSDIRNLGYFNSIGSTALKVGSVKVSTINLARIALDSSTEDEYIANLENRLDINFKALDRVRHIIRRNAEKGLLPNFTYGLVDFEHLYNTCGFIGVYESMKKFGYTTMDEFGNVYYTEEAHKFGKRIFETIRRCSAEFVERNGCDYQINTEQIPGETAADKLMRKDKHFYPDANIYDLPLYGNQFMPLGIKTTLQERIKEQALFDGYCNGGSILHANIDAPFDSYEKAREMTEYIADAGVTYFAFNTKIQACEDNHAFYGTKCPVCGKPVDGEYSRVVGFYTKTKSWSDKRRQEYDLRKWENVNDS